MVVNIYVEPIFDPTLLALCAGNSPVIGEFPSQRPVTPSFDVFFDLCMNKRLSKSREAGDLRRHHAHYDVIVMTMHDSLTFDVTMEFSLKRFNAQWTRDF